MELELDVRKSAQENAADYFDSSKKKRMKAERALGHIAELESRIEKASFRAESFGEVRKNLPKRKEWYGEFRWFFSSDSHLIVGGRSAEQNERLVKKKMAKDDVVFHTEMAGSPFVLVKGGKTPATLEEAAIFTASYSRAWKAGLGITDVYWVNPEQVSKKAPAGEYVGRGAFMVYGKKNYFKNVALETCVGWDGKAVIYGPLSAVKPKAKQLVVIKPAGKLEQAELAKAIKKLLPEAQIDDIVKALPSGKGEILATPSKA